MPQDAGGGELEAVEGGTLVKVGWMRGGVGGGYELCGGRDRAKGEGEQAKESAMSPACSDGQL